eukprot:TRINITY_DN2934_c0_g1_i1.p1 TRINITY_DN2934_c0_g1~~TRINITY_DN2934_c0_g1_i1.p1  ORF type:complete len:362 (+),score=76.13 TRINITY_DN2934_c0_g1_i1:247-1332(+)
MSLYNKLITIVAILPVLLLSLTIYISYYHPASGSSPYFLYQGHNIDWKGLNPDLVVGRTYLVTGANAGIGYETTKSLFEKGGKVVLTCRTNQKCADAKTKILEQTQLPYEDNLIILEDLELSSFSSVKNFINKYKSSDLNLDVIILNAGIMHVPYGLSEDGLERTLAVNHFSQMALTLGLLPKLLESEYSPRIVVVSSIAHLNSYEKPIPLTIEEVNNETKYDKRKAYGQSKLANILFTRELQKRLDNAYPDKKIYVNAPHPGVVVSELARYRNEVKGIELLFHNNLFNMKWPTFEGSLTQLACAVDPRVEEEDIRGEYWIPIARNADWASSEISQDMELAKQFYEFSEEVLTKHGLPVDL